MVMKLKQRKNNNYLRKNNELQKIHLNESYIAALSSVTVYYALQDGCNFDSVDEILASRADVLWARHAIGRNA